MPETQIDAGTLTASREDRTVTGLLVPYEEECRSNLGRFKVGTGAFTLPADAAIVGFNEEHDRESVIGRATQLHETPQGIVGTFSIARTPEGDQALEDIAAGRRKHLSSEVAGVVIRAGRAVGGRLFGAALVLQPAFPSATLLAAAVDTGEDPEPQEEVHEETTTAPDGSVVDTKTTVTEETEDLGDGKSRRTTTTVVVEETTPPEEGTQPVTTPPAAPAAPPQTLVARLRGGQAPATSTPRTPPAPAGISKETLFAGLAAATQDPYGNEDLVSWLSKQGRAGATLYGRREDTLQAALSDIKATTVPNGGHAIAPTMVQPQWLGEIWADRVYQRRYIPLFASKPLTGFGIQGYKWKTKPGVGPWAGNKENVPSNPIEVEPYSYEPEGLAGANDIDRRFRDFNVPGFWESYFKYMTESYAKQSDQGVLATVVENAAHVPMGAVPAGIAPGLVAIVDGALAVLDQGSPTFALVAKNVWRQLLLTPKDKVLEYLSESLGLEEGQAIGFKILPATGADLANDQVLVGIGSAACSFELPGSPIRVEGLDMARGGIDPGLFGYWNAIVEEETAFALVDSTP